MGRRRQRIKKVAISRNIRDFANDVFDYILSKQCFSIERADQKRFNGFGSIYLYVGERAITNFTENIGKAVRVSQFLLRDYFLNFFKFLTPEKSYFKKEVKLLWSHWLDNRNSIFVKVIETIAIIAEAFLFCDCHVNFKLEFNEMTDWFIELFEENLASEFFKNGGWEKLYPSSDGWYIGMFHFLEERADMSYSYFLSGAVKNIYNCDLINIIRYAVIKYPVPDDVICDNCRHPGDANFYQSVFYVRLANEKPEIIPSKEPDNSSTTLPAVIQSKVKNESLCTDQKVSSKYPFDEDALSIKQDSMLLKLEEQNFNGDNLKYISKTCPSLFSKSTSTNADDSSHQDFKRTLEENFRKNLKEANIKLLTAASSSSSREIVPIDKIFSRELNQKREQNEEILNEIVARREEIILPDDIFSGKRLKVHNEKDSEEKQCSFINFESKIPSSADSEINYVIEFPSNTEFVHIIPYREQSPKSKISLDAPLSKWSTPESSSYLQQTLTNKEWSATKSILKIVPPDKKFK